jgi:hypothetical protein
MALRRHFYRHPSCDVPYRKVVRLRYVVLRPRTPLFRRPRDHHSGDRAVRPDRRAVGGAGTAAAHGQEARPSAEVDQTPTHRRGQVADPGRFALARRAGVLWAMADGLRPVPPLATRRHLATHPGGVADPRRCGRPDHLGCQRRYDDRQSAPARRWGAEKGDLQREPPAGVAAVEPSDHALGRSRGGWTTKLHLACEQGRNPLSILITAGQRGDSPQFAAVIERIRVPRHGAGRPRTRPD